MMALSPRFLTVLIFIVMGLLIVVLILFALTPTAEESANPGGEVYTHVQELIKKIETDFSQHGEYRYGEGLIQLDVTKARYSYLIYPFSLMPDTDTNNMAFLKVIDHEGGVALLLFFGPDGKAAEEQTVISLPDKGN